MLKVVFLAALGVVFICHSQANAINKEGFYFEKYSNIKEAEEAFLKLHPIGSFYGTAIKGLEDVGAKCEKRILKHRIEENIYFGCSYSYENKDWLRKPSALLYLDKDNERIKKIQFSDTVIKNVSKFEDLISAQKLEFLEQEYIIKDGKKILLSPKTYKSEDGCDQARELYKYRKKMFTLGDRGVFKKFFIKHFIYRYFDDGVVYLLKDKDHIKVFYRINFDFVEEIPRSEKLYKYNVLFKSKSNINTPARFVGDSTKDFWTEENKQKYLFLEEKDCIVTYYRGENF